jgi:hypothetical protein
MPVTTGDGYKNESCPGVTERPGTGVSIVAAPSPKTGR